MNVRYNWHDSFGRNVFNAAIPATVTQPRVNNNWLGGYTHTLKPNLLNDFRIGYHRLNFDTLNPFAVDGPQTRGVAGHPRLRRRREIQQPRAAEHQHQQLQARGRGTNWFQFDTTFQMSNVLAYSAGAHNLRAGFDLRRLAPAPRRERSARAVRFTNDITGYAMAASCSACRAR